MLLSPKRSKNPKPPNCSQVLTAALIPIKKRTREVSESQRVPLPIRKNGTQKVFAKKESVESSASQSAGTGGTLSLLDGFDAEKYASIDTQSEALDESDDDDAVSLDTTETKYASYFSRIKHQIERVWTYPSEAAQRGINGELTLKFRISKDGNLLGVRLIDPSSHEILDLAAIKAVKEAAPFYPFPTTIKKEKLSILATFIYSPTYGLLRKE
jgi:protein TonB